MSRNIQIIPSEYLETIKIYQEEWKKVIDLQTHFNELVIQARIKTFTIFIASIGGILGYLTAMKIDIAEVSTLDANNRLLFILPLIFLSIGFLLDYLYYSKLINSSVEFAKKFDDNDFLKSYKLFGLSSFISKNISKNDYYITLFIFYFIPLFSYLGFLVFIYNN
ncbi:MAG: hypothetical protein PHE25_04390 [Candidatus Gracilibacteria bacterium]|nr:hypothetical protein [Candidatus Gracilibacteria bacterium]